MVKYRQTKQNVNPSPVSFCHHRLGWSDMYHWILAKKTKNTNPSFSTTCYPRGRSTFPHLWSAMLLQTIKLNLIFSVVDRLVSQSQKPERTPPAPPCEPTTSPCSDQDDWQALYPIKVWCQQTSSSWFNQVKCYLATVTQHGWQLEPGVWARFLKSTGRFFLLKSPLCPTFKHSLFWGQKVIVC